MLYDIICSTINSLSTWTPLGPTLYISVLERCPLIEKQLKGLKKGRH